jgi:hypothetical protein
MRWWFRTLIAICSDQRSTSRAKFSFANDLAEARVEVERRQNSALKGSGPPEVDLEVEFFFKQVGAAFGVANIFGDVAASVDFERDGIPLK